MRALFVLAVTAFLFSISSGAQAWSFNQHKAICAIAITDLKINSSQAYETMIELFKGNEWGIDDPVDMCVFADQLRRYQGFNDDMKARAKRRGHTSFDRYRDWHYVNVDADDDNVSTSDCGDDGCVPEAIRTHFRQLRDDDNARWKREDALIFLSHWVGDVHQPLHAGLGRDRGGNSVLVDWFLTDTTVKTLKRYLAKETKSKPACSSLHQIWDGCIVKIKPNEVSAVAASLYGQIRSSDRTSWRRGDAWDWANESLDIALEDEEYCELENRACKVLAPEFSANQAARDAKERAYLNKYQDVVKTRLKKAGIRLAWMLEKALE